MPDQLLVDQGIPRPNEGHCSAIAVRRHRFHLNDLGEDQDGGDVLGLGPEILILLRAVNPRQADLPSPALVEDGDAVAVNDADDFGGLGPGERG